MRGDELPLATSMIPSSPMLGVTPVSVTLSIGSPVPSHAVPAPETNGT